ncbi:MAG: hypothetical protein ACI3T9_03535 [Romboutsia timonensis]
MANLGNTIINGTLRVNGKINASDVISAPSFVGALTGNADTATKLKTARTINGVNFDGSANITIPYLKSIDLRGAYKPSNMKNGYISSVFSTLGGLDGSASDSKWVDVIGLSTWGDNGGNGVNALVATKRTADGQALYHYYGDFGATTWKSKKQIAYIDSNITGNANTATKLATARTINGVSFDGSANITVADSTKLPLSGGTMTGTISSALSGSWLQGGTGERALVKSTSAGSAHTALWSAASTNGKFQIFKYTNYMGFGYESTTNIDAGTNSLTYGAFFNESGAFYPSKDNAQTLGTSSVKWNNVYATTFTGALSGNATSAGTTATTDTNPTSGTWYYPTWVNGTSGNLGHRVNDGYKYYSLQGTTSAVGHSYIQIGNATASGTAGNKQGHLRVYSASSGYTDIVTTTSTSNFTITLPAASGTVSLTSHTHSAATTSANGFMSSADKTKLNALHYVRSGTAVPDSSLGENGDIYILLES